MSKEKDRQEEKQTLLPRGSQRFEMCPQPR
jgi:hypothetical protein